MQDGILGTGDLIWKGIAATCSGYNGNYTIGCQASAIANFGDQYFYEFIDNLAYFTFDKAIDERVLRRTVLTIFLTLGISFIVGFIFFHRK